MSLNASFGPPPLPTPITADQPDEFGVPYQSRGTPAGNLNVNWAAWFNEVFARLSGAVPVYGTHAERIAVNGGGQAINPPSAFPDGALWVETDTGKIYQAHAAVLDGAGNITTPSAWVLILTAPVITGSVSTVDQMVKVTGTNEIGEAAFAEADVVTGAPNLTTPGAVPMVDSAGVLKQSSLSDNGTTVSTAEPISTGTHFVAGGFSGITASIVLAKLTTLGTNGLLGVQGGIIVSLIPPT